jgi:hypothetical protein
MTRRTCVTMPALFCAALMLLSAEGAAARSRNSVSAKRTLSSTGVDPDARGEMKVSIRRKRSTRRRAGGVFGKLEVKVKKLEGRTTYDVSLDGVKIGTLDTSRSGSGRA